MSAGMSGEVLVDLGIHGVVLGIRPSHQAANQPECSHSVILRFFQSMSILISQCMEGPAVKYLNIISFHPFFVEHMFPSFHCQCHGSTFCPHLDSSPK